MTDGGGSQDRTAPAFLEVEEDAQERRERENGAEQEEPVPETEGAEKSWCPIHRPFSNDNLAQLGRSTRLQREFTETLQELTPSLPMAELSYIHRS